MGGRDTAIWISVCRNGRAWCSIHPGNLLPGAQFIRALLPDVQFIQAICCLVLRGNLLK